MQASWSRRTFLGAAVGSAAVWSTRRWARAADPANQYGGFNLGMQSYTLRDFKVDRALAEIKKLGLHSVEFFNAHFSAKSSDADIEAMKSKTQALGIKIMGHGVNPFTKDHEANRRWFEFAKKAGIRNISADPTEDAFDSLDKLCEEYQIRIAIHNHGPGARYDKVTDVLNAIKGHHPLIGACADLGHYIRSAEDPVRVINLLRRPAVRHPPQGFRRAKGQHPGRDSRPRPSGRGRRVQGAAQSQFPGRRLPVAGIRREPERPAGRRQGMPGGGQRRRP